MTDGPTKAMQYLNKRSAEHRAALEATQRKFEKEAQVLSQLPTTDEEPSIVIQTDSAWITYEPANISRGLEILELFKPYKIPFYILRATFLHISPRELIKADEWDKATGEIKIDDGAALRISQGKGFGPDAELSIWAKIGDDVLRVRIEIGSQYFNKQTYPPKWRPQINAEYDKWGNCIRATKRPPQIVSDHPVISWGTGSLDSCQYSFVWHEWQTMRNELAPEQVTP
jgi:hypothetical protein